MSKISEAAIYSWRGAGVKGLRVLFLRGGRGERVSTPLHAMVCLKITDFIYGNRVTIAFLLEVPF